MEEQQKLDAYRIEVVLTALQRKCFDLCVPPPPQFAWTPEEHLTDDEAKCIDKCNWKFLETHRIVTHQINRAQGGGKR